MSAGVNETLPVAGSTAHGQRIPELDGLRGVAVLMVLVWHYLGPVGFVSTAPWAQAALALARPGRWGVDLFFVLSGFLIAGVVYDRRAPRWRFLRRFYLRRALRILPPYAVLLLMLWAVLAIGVRNHDFNEQVPWWRLLTLTQNYWMSQEGLWGPSSISATWSLAVEEHFYLIAPLLIVAVAPRHTPTLLIGVAAVSALLRAWTFHFGSDPNPGFSAYVSTHCRLDGIALGACAAWLVRTDGARAALDRQRRWLVLLWLAAAPGLVLLGWMMTRDLAWHMNSWGHTFLAVYFTATLLLLITGGVRHPAHAVLSHPWLGGVGRISYALYLFHPSMLAITWLCVGGPDRSVSAKNVLSVLSALVATAMLSILLKRYMEDPLQRAASRFPY